MEWAIGKSYDLFTPNTGKLLLPGSKISWDIHIHAVGEEIPTGVEIGLVALPEGPGAEVSHAPDARFPAKDRAESRYSAE